MFAAAHVPTDRIVLRPATFDRVRAGSGSPASSIADSDEEQEIEPLVDLRSIPSADYFSASGSSGAHFYGAPQGAQASGSVRTRPYGPSSRFVKLDEDTPVSAERTSLGEPSAEPPDPPLVDRAASPEPIVTSNENSAQAHSAKKRRKKGPRFTRVKNERKKKAEANAEQAARRTERKPPAPKKAAKKEVGRRPQPEPVQEDVDWSTRRMTRAAARAQGPRQQPAETAQPVRRSSRRKDKGKQRVKDEPEPDSKAKKSLKRRRRDDEDEGDVAKTPVSQNEAGSSRLARRTRRKLESEEKEEVKLGPRGQAWKRDLTLATERGGASYCPRGRRGSDPNPMMPLDVGFRRPRFATPERPKTGYLDPPRPTGNSVSG